MIRRISLCLCLGLFLATNAWAQLASQTALVGTVTDSGNLVVPGPGIAVNVGTKDTYEPTTNAEGYYKSSSSALARTISLSRFRISDVQGNRRRGGQ